MFSCDLHLYCSCGRHREIRSEDVPEAWLASPDWIHPEVFERMLCLACGRRGRPLYTIVIPVGSRYENCKTAGMMRSKD